MPMDVATLAPEVATGGSGSAVMAESAQEGLFSGRDTRTIDAHQLVQSQIRRYLQGEPDTFKQPGLKKNKTLVGLFASCARLDLGRKFTRLARDHGKAGVDNADAMIELIVACSNHQRFMPAFRKLFPDLPGGGQEGANAALDAVEAKDCLTLVTDPVGVSEHAGHSESKSPGGRAGSGKVESPVAGPVLVVGAIPLHASQEDVARRSWSEKQQNRFVKMRDMLVAQRMANEDTSDFRGARFFKAEAGNTASQCGDFSSQGMVRRLFYQAFDERVNQAIASAGEGFRKRISIKTIRKELDDLVASLSLVAWKEGLPVNCDLVIQLYRNGQPGHTRSFSVWKEGDQIMYGAQRPGQEMLKCRKAVLMLTAESLALLNSRQILDAQIVFEQHWISVSGDPGFVRYIRELIAHQGPDKKDV